MAYRKRRRRLSKFQLSQMAHKRLSRRDTGSKSLYHLNVFSKQSRLKRILSQSERQQIYKNSFGDWS